MEKKKILLVDDDPDFLEATRIVLASQPEYEVITALNGNDGLKLAKDRKPDLIILDIIMPDPDGFKVCQQLKSDPQFASTPVIMLTSLAQKIGETRYSMTEALSLEADDYVDKPVAPTELLQRVNRLLSLKKESRE